LEYTVLVGCGSYWFTRQLCPGSRELLDNMTVADMMPPQPPGIKRVVVVGLGMVAISFM
jgi:hypothetical protein